MNFSLASPFKPPSKHYNVAGSFNDFSDAGEIGWWIFVGVNIDCAATGAYAVAIIGVLGTNIGFCGFKLGPRSSSFDKKFCRYTARWWYWCVCAFQLQGGCVFDFVIVKPNCHGVC